MPGFDVDRGSITQFWVKVLSNASDRAKGAHLKLTDAEVAKLAKRFGIELPKAKTLSGYQSVGVYPPSAQGAARSYKAERKGYHGLYNSAPLASLVNGVVARMTENNTSRNHVDFVDEDEDVPATRGANRKKKAKPAPRRKAVAPKPKKKVVDEDPESDSDEDDIAVEFRTLAALEDAASKERVDMSMAEASDLVKVVHVANRFGGRGAPKVVKHMLQKRIQKKNAGIDEAKALKLAERVMEAIA